MIMMESMLPGEPHPGTRVPVRLPSPLFGHLGAGRAPTSDNVPMANSSSTAIAIKPAVRNPPSVAVPLTPVQRDQAIASGTVKLTPAQQASSVGGLLTPVQQAASTGTMVPLTPAQRQQAADVGTIVLTPVQQSQMPVVTAAASAMGTLMPGTGVIRATVQVGPKPTIQVGPTPRPTIQVGPTPTTTPVKQPIKTPPTGPPVTPIKTPIFTTMPGSSSTTTPAAAPPAPPLDMTNIEQPPSMPPPSASPPQVFVPPQVAQSTELVNSLSPTASNSQVVSTSDTVDPSLDLLPFPAPVADKPSIWKNPYFWLAVGGGVIAVGGGIYLIRRRRRAK